MIRNLHNNWAWWVRPVFAMLLLCWIALYYGRGHTGSKASTQETLRLAYMPNITHAPALLGVEQGNFQKALGAVGLETRVLNAGPEVMEALLAGEADVAYVGPSPAINTFVKTQGRAVRILAGACSGGASLIVAKDSPIQSVRDLNGKRVAVSQIGSTQDISLRYNLAKEGLKAKEKQGTVEILPMKPSDILALFQRNQVDAAWLAEPWVSRIMKETGAKLILDERSLWADNAFTTTVIVARKAYLDKYPDRVEAMLRAHRDILQKIERDPNTAKQGANREIKRLMTKALPSDILEAAWGRMKFTSDPNKQCLEAFGQRAFEVGYLDKQPDLSQLVDLTLWRKVVQTPQH